MIELKTNVWLSSMKRCRGSYSNIAAQWSQSFWCLMNSMKNRQLSIIWYFALSARDRTAGCSNITLNSAFHSAFPALCVCGGMPKQNIFNISPRMIKIVKHFHFIKYLYILFSLYLLLDTLLVLYLFTLKRLKFSLLLSSAEKRKKKNFPFPFE